MLDGKQVAQVLREQGITQIHHVNTASTAFNYLRHQAIMSRQFVHENPHKYWQTIQGTDHVDIAHGIFNDIFFDVENIWERSGYNFYGPVVFTFETSILAGRSINISTDNPTHWDTMLHDKRYISDIDDVVINCMSGGAWNLKNHIILPQTPTIDLSYLNKITFYIPPHILPCKDINNPESAANTIAHECEKLDIAFALKTAKEPTPENKYGLFYGFMMKVI